MIMKCVSVLKSTLKMPYNLVVMNSKQCLLITFFFLTNIIFAFAQISVVKGTIVNGEGTHVEFANVSIIRNDTIHVAQTITDSLGIFSLNLDKGQYTLVVTQFGSEFFREAFFLESDKVFGRIIINESLILEDITIEAQKRLFERKIDRLVYNVENTIASRGMNGLDILKNTPLVNAQDGSISIVGKSSVSVMVNGRMLNISGSELVNYLESLSSDNISKVEIITTPPANYDSEGNSGIINIILKRNNATGLTGILSSSYTRNHLNSYVLNSRTSYQSESTIVSLNLRNFVSNQLAYYNSNIIGQQSLYSNTDRKDMNNGWSINFDLEQNLTKKSLIGIKYLYSGMHNDQDIYNFSDYQYNSMRDSLLAAISTRRSKTQMHALSGYYEIRLDTTGKKISLISNYYDSNPVTNTEYFIANQTQGIDQRALTDNGVSFKIISGLIDLTLPYQSATVEAGLKYNRFLNKADLNYFNLVNNHYQRIDANSGMFNFVEENLAAYFSMDKTINEKWSTKLGLRYEHAINKFPDQSTSTRNYGAFFPSFYLIYRPNHDRTISFSYSKRISRPSLQSVNPNKVYFNPYSFVQGKPDLLPSYVNNIELSFLLKNKLSLTTYAQFSTNNSGQIVLFENGTRITTYENFYNQRNTGLTLSYNNTLLNIWEMVLASTAYYNKSKSLLPNILDQESFSAYYSINNTLSLNKPKTLQLFANFWNYLPYTFGNVRMNNMYQLSSGVRLALLDKKLNVQATFRDILKSNIGRGYEKYADYITTFDNYYDSHSLTVSMSYNFGNVKTKRNNKRIDFDEQNRAN